MRKKNKVPVSVSVMIFGSRHLILFIGSTNYFQIVRRQCCPPFISKGGQVDSMHKSSPLAKRSISWRQILCCYLGGPPPHPTSILGRPGAYVSCQSLVQVALDQCTCTGDRSLFISSWPFYLHNFIQFSCITLDHFSVTTKPKKYVREPFVYVLAEFVR